MYLCTYISFIRADLPEIDVMDGWMDILLTNCWFLVSNMRIKLKCHRNLTTVMMQMYYLSLLASYLNFLFPVLILETA